MPLGFPGIGGGGGGILSAGLASAAVSAWDPPIFGSSNITNQTIGQNSVYLYPVDIPAYVSAYRLNLFASVGTTSGPAINSTWAAGHTASCALYAMDVGTNSTQITSFWSMSFYMQVAGSSNTNMTYTGVYGISNSGAVSTQQGQSSSYLASSVGGFRVIPLPLSSILSAGRYWFAMAKSTSSGNVGNTMEVSYLMHTQALIAYRPFGTSSAASNAGYYMGPYQGIGIYNTTSTAFPGTIGMTTNQITANASATRIYFNLSAYTTNTNIL